MKRRLQQSGCEKRKAKKRVEEERDRLPKLTSFFPVSVNTEKHENEESSSPTENNEEPSSSANERTKMCAVHCAPSEACGTVTASPVFNRLETILAAGRI